MIPFYQFKADQVHQSIFEAPLTCLGSFEENLFLLYYLTIKYIP